MPCLFFTGRYQKWTGMGPVPQPACRDDGVGGEPRQRQDVVDAGQGPQPQVGRSEPVLPRPVDGSPHGQGGADRRLEEGDADDDAEVTCRTEGRRRRPGAPAPGYSRRPLRGGRQKTGGSCFRLLSLHPEGVGVNSLGRKPQAGRHAPSVRRIPRRASRPKSGKDQPRPRHGPRPPRRGLSFPSPAAYAISDHPAFATSGTCLSAV